MRNKKKSSRKGPLTAKANPGDPQSNFLNQFGFGAAEKQPADRRQELAVLKIMESIVSGRIPRRRGEDYFITVCRLKGNGVPDVKLSAVVRRELNVALAELKKAGRRTTASMNLVKMRSWRGKRAIIRVTLLLNALEKAIGPLALIPWLEQPNPNLGRRSPIALMRNGSWTILADFLDDMLTGPT